jgi:hypothetical protein
LTPKHLIARSSQANATPSFVYAEHVQENDYIHVRDKYNQLMSVKVKSVSEEVKMGYYAPLTLEGTYNRANNTSADIQTATYIF